MGVQAPFVSANSETEAFSRRARHTRILVDATRDLTNNPRPSAQQIEAYKELFYQLADRLLPADRRLISALVARSAFTPRAVALYLAQDSLDVAIPCLLYSPVLGELDLKEIARKMGPAHGDVIAKRIVPPMQGSADEAEAAEEPPMAPETTVETVVAAGEPVVPEANEISLQDTASQAIRLERSSPFGRTPTEASLIEEAAEDAIGEPGEAEWLNGEEIVALASSGGRLGRQKSNQHAQPDTGLASSESTAGERTAATALQHREKHFSPLAMRDTRHLLALARNQNRKALSKKIAALSGLEDSTISALLRKTRGDEIAYLVKALNPGSPQDLKLLLMIAPRYGRTQDAYRSAKTLLGELDTGICRMIFNQVGATFDLPRLETIVTPGAEADAEFARAARVRREEIGRGIDGRSVEARPVPNPAGQPAHGGRVMQPAGA
ncbi:MAG: hypothetical protein R3D35_08985 [Nitratireductor sp.]